ncbi:peptide chain release factor N(5)-glutamine methyltransferase [Siculibacillus lacustris]|uniref:Release factor glutamine methyltransferase n=1 Tax=Siculibacillus lacustris TaxID=1549641 RepID=A0A4Q9VX37_9HYPH|nr:peptide chain release factor N(5)-glutamine methyltransferase [Siculibacillus lacustris]TBW40454.1 peptide chain release factor N(5)-glutamine methyltransferase [Siculibacillus lacustris]
MSGDEPLVAPGTPATVGGVTRRLRAALAAAGIDGAEIEARRMVGAVTGLDLTGLVTGADRPLDATALARLEGWRIRRLAGEPVERLIGAADFFGLAFALSAETLVPRSDTETLVVAVLEALTEARCTAPVIADLGVGSGAILVTLLHEVPGAIGIGTDLSADALATARANAGTHGVAARALMLRGSWAESLALGAFDVVVSNPPYIETATIAGLDREVRVHDPIRALDGGADGLDAYRAILATAPQRLRPGGLLAVEIGAGQGTAVTALFASAGLGAIALVRDLAGRDRVVLGRRSTAGSSP